MPVAAERQGEESEWQDVRDGTDRHVARRVDLRMRGVVVDLDVLELGCIAEGRVLLGPVELAQVFVDLRVAVADRADVALRRVSAELFPRCAR